MPKRSAHTSWTGGLQDGSGHVTLVSSGAGQYDVSFPKRAADDAQGTTSPEELIAAAHSACYAMQLSALIARADATPKGLEVDATVSLEPDPAGGFRISTIALVVRATLEGLDDEGFKKVANEAKSQCPVSKALTGTTITLDAALA
ncbi:MAG: OsmC family peroxiredoxin [Acidimicrobiales bacterium]